MDIEMGAHCRYQIRYHIVWKIKYSHKLLFGSRITFLKQTIQDIAERYDYNLEAVGIDENHIHIFIGAHPVTAPAKLIQVLKSITAREMFRRFPEVKQFLWGGSFWAIGYYIRTVSDGPLDRVIKNYVEEQNKDKKKSQKPYQLKLVP
jgi:putative transposase